MRYKSTKAARFRNHVSIEDSFEFSRFVKSSDGCVEIASFVSMVLVWLGTSPVKEVRIFDADSLTCSLELFIFAIIGENDSELVSWVVNLKRSLDSVKHNVTRLATGDNEDIDCWNIVTNETKGGTGDLAADAVDQQAP
jgi:hypothetical protein